MRDHLRTSFLREAHGTAEVVGVRVRDEDRVDVLHAELGLLQAILERGEAAGARQAGVDQRAAVVVDERIAVDVAEAGEPDRKLHPEHVLGDLRDLGARLLLLLLARLAAHAVTLPDRRPERANGAATPP